MLNIREELTLCLMRRGMSMRKVAKILRQNGCDVPVDSGLSDSLKKNRIRFQTVQEILDLLGYELVIKEKH